VEARFIYRNRSDLGFYDASTREMRGGPDKVIVYVNGVLCAMDREAKVVIPVSRWKLMEIGVACFLAALKAKGAASGSLESVPVPEPPPALPEAVDEHLSRSLDDDERAPPEAIHQESSEPEWEHLLREMRNLSR
jgi:hypothetical protein